MHGTPAADWPTGPTVAGGSTARPARAASAPPGPGPPAGARDRAGSAAEARGVEEVDVEGPEPDREDEGQEEVGDRHQLGHVGVVGPAPP